MNPAPARPAAAGRGCFVTGTDTGVGKTLCSVGLIHALRAQGLRVAGMKPLAAGAEAHGDSWRNEDAVALQKASEPRPEDGDVNPILLRTATAPEIAAQLERARVSPEQVDPAWHRLGASHDFVVVEGAGGWLSPLSDSWMQADVARRYQLPVVLVVGLRLGCINHALLSLRAIRADGLVPCGWLLSCVDADLAHAEAYAEVLCSRIDAPLLGRLEHGADPAQAAESWHIEPILGLAR
ncbi:MAG: dethiobiotin synthase [Xanthomonadales bacterium]|nr:dethiobiotin synthase [Xanthomonadales bacterium]